jgi:hypothetical protein
MDVMVVVSVSVLSLPDGARIFGMGMTSLGKWVDCGEFDCALVLNVVVVLRRDAFVLLVFRLFLYELCSFYFTTPPEMYILCKKGAAAANSSKNCSCNLERVKQQDEKPKPQHNFCSKIAGGNRGNVGWILLLQLRSCLLAVNQHGSAVWCVRATALLCRKRGPPVRFAVSTLFAN